MNHPPHDALRFSVVKCMSRINVLVQQLTQSPCLQKGGLPWTAYFNSPSATQAFYLTRVFPDVFCRLVM